MPHPPIARDLLEYFAIPAIESAQAFVPDRQALRPRWERSALDRELVAIPIGQHRRLIVRCTRARWDEDLDRKSYDRARLSASPGELVKGTPTALLERLLYRLRREAGEEREGVED